MVHREDDDCADHRSDEAGGLALAIPADELAEPGRDNSADNAQYGGDEAAAELAATGQKLGDHAGKKADDDDPDDVHDLPSLATRFRTTVCLPIIAMEQPCRYSVAIQRWHIL